MATTSDRLTAVERDLLALEKRNQMALDGHAKENQMALEAVHVRMDEMEQKIDSFGPVLEGISTNVSVLVSDKTGRDAMAKAEAAKKPKTPWDIFKAKLIDALATLTAGVIMAGIGFVAVQWATKGHL